MTLPVRRLPSLAAAVLSLLLVACGSPVNQDNFKKIETGMTQAEVEAILGRPDESSSASLGNFSGGSSTWKAGDASITVQFMNDRVQFKQFTKGGPEQ